MAEGDRVTFGDDRRVVVAPREFTLDNADRVWARLHIAIEGDGVVLLDMSECEFIDSAASGVILLAARELRRRQSRLALVGIGDQPSQILGMTSLFELPNVLRFGSGTEARGALGIAG